MLQRISPEDGCPSLTYRRGEIQMSANFYKNANNAPKFCELMPTAANVEIGAVPKRVKLVDLEKHCKTIL